MSIEVLCNVEKILDGTKIFTICEIGKNEPPEVGKPLILTGDTSGSIQPIFPPGKEPLCSWVWPIGISGRWLSCEFPFEVMRKMERFKIPKNRYKTNYYYKNNNDMGVLNEFAILDGWNNFSEMYEFYKCYHDVDIQHNPFYGNLISWIKLPDGFGKIDVSQFKNYIFKKQLG